MSVLFDGPNKAPKVDPYLRPLINEFNQYVGTQYDWATGY